MNTIKPILNFNDYAKSLGRGLGSVALKDGSEVKILSRPSGKHSTNFYRVKNGEFLEAYGCHKIKDILAKLMVLEKNKAPNVDVSAEFYKSFDKIV